MSPASFSRRAFLGTFPALAALGCVAPELVADTPAPAQNPSREPLLDVNAIQGFERVSGTPFTPAEREQMLESLREQLAGYTRLRSVELDNSVLPAFRFDPLPPGEAMPTVAPPDPADSPPAPPHDWRDQLHWLSIRQLGVLLRDGRLSSLDLTRYCLDRIERLDPTLRAVITLTRERALEAAARADEEFRQGRDRGPLHGIPYGAKDLLAVADYPTTWGATPYREQILATNATVINRLDQAGAVLVAKLSLGALAWGDVWFDATTRNPWNPEEGSSGSSAGSASAVAAGMVPFAISSETLGSIVSPCTRCGATGIRPTFGRVSRAGAMTLSWTMDKIGPIARNVDDASLVLAAIAGGADALDPTVVAQPYHHPTADQGLAGVRVGVVRAAFEDAGPEGEFDLAVLNDLRRLGAELIDIELPTDLPAGAMLVILAIEAATAFDALTRSNRDDLLVRQSLDAWPTVFRAAQTIPAVEYVRANRWRTLLMQRMAGVFRRVDCYVAPSFSPSLTITNLTGHPCVVAPSGFRPDGTPVSITFTGALYREDLLVRLARVWQQSTDWHLRHPNL